MSRALSADDKLRMMTDREFLIEKTKAIVEECADKGRAGLLTPADIDYLTNIRNVIYANARFDELAGRAERATKTHGIVASIDKVLNDRSN